MSSYDGDFVILKYPGLEVEWLGKITMDDGVPYRLVRHCQLNDNGDRFVFVSEETNCLVIVQKQ